MRFLSCEPLLGPVNLNQIVAPGDNREFHFSALQEQHDDWFYNAPSTIDLMIVGGESGHGACPMHPEWARSLRDQCQAAGVSFFFKQWGEWWGEWWPYPDEINEISVRRNLKDSGQTQRQGDWFFERNGKKTAGRLLDGREWNEFPEVN